MTFHHILLRWGMGGLPFEASARAHEWERRLNWPLFALLWLAVPAFYLEISSTTPELRLLGGALIGLIVAGFCAHMGFMLWLYRHRSDYLHRNWMNLVIIIGASLNLMQIGVPQSAFDWAVRIIWQVSAFVRLLGFLAELVRPGGLLRLLLLAIVVLAASGLGYYWLEPTVHTYGEGLWLAFGSAATVGYGDFVPTTAASRLFSVFIVLLGYAVLSLVTAGIAAMLIGEEEKELRREVHRDVRALRSEISELRRAIESLDKRVP